VDGVARADLDRSLAAALDAYRRFLADEEGFAVAGSAAFDAAPAPLVRPPRRPFASAGARCRWWCPAEPRTDQRYRRMSATLHQFAAVPVDVTRR
jgi:hypothetical protein